uniref:Sorting nexin n=1 Tax=Onchocerca volvulus TaxID=6282 RepID=A0A8R1TTG8_ONCVO
MTQVRAVYEFEAQPNSGELSISVNEVLTVVREGIQGGWLEGRNAKGQHGLFPESYVVKINASPTIPKAFASQHHNLPAFAVDDSWNAPPASAHYPQLSISSNEQQLHNVAAPPMFVSASHDDDDFDDWTDDDEEFSESVLNTADNPEMQNYISSNPATKGDVLVKQGTVRMKNINRQVIFSNFVKSGMEDYILLSSRITSKAEEHHEIILTLDGAEWIPVAQPYYCIVDKPKKESKLKGLKSFIAYSVKSSLSGIQVSRRYKHFDWLYERMSAKYILIPLPPLPEKQVAGRYEEDFIEHRKNILQIWVNKVCRHPVLSKSDVWIHFVTCTDEKKWKSGKRKAEKDEYVGGNFLYSITVPNQPLDSNDVEQKVDNFTRSMRSFEESVHFMYNRVSETHKRLAGAYKTNWQKMGEACTGLCRSFDINPSSKNEKVTSALKETAKTLHWIGDEHEKLAKKSLDPLLDALYSYKGMLACIPDIVNVHKSAISKLRENEKLAIEGRVSSADMDKVKEKVDSISYMMLAEMAFQNHELGEDFKNMMATYLESQGEFFMNIGNQLSNLARKFKRDGTVDQ